MSPTMTKALEIVLQSIEKNHGKGSIMKLTDEVNIDPDNTISTGSIGIDAALGIGGYRKGRIVEIFGPESCIAGDSFLQYEVWSKGPEGKQINHKGGTIARLYERFKNIQVGKEPNQGRHLQNNSGTFYVKSVNDEGLVVRNEVLDVVKTGTKECHRVTTEEGFTLVSTAEHKYMTPFGFKPLSDLKEGDMVFIHNNTRTKGRKKYPNRPEIYVKYHPSWPTKIVHDPESQKDYIYYRGQKSRAVYEAHLNNISYDLFIEILNTWDAKGIDQTLRVLPQDIHVHHKDEDFMNNNLSNLQLIDPSEHGKLHANDRIKNLSFVTIPTKIVRIEPIGELCTYDLKCMYPYNNYIANGIVVHNSGKTTLTLEAIANAQKQGQICAFIDAEHSLDPIYASNIGVDLDSLLISQPDFGEQALNIVAELARSGEVGLIVIDSVAALTPRKELEGDIGDHHVGSQARLMSQAMRILHGIANQTGCSIIFVNQIRMKIGVLFGSPETTTGGNALKFYASQRLDIRRIGSIKEGDKIIGNRTKVKVVKNKLAPPFRVAEFDIRFGIGIDKIAELVDIGVEDEVVDKAGAWYSFEGTRIGQGKANAITFLKENEDIRKAIKAEVTELRGISDLTKNDTKEDSKENKDESKNSNSSGKEPEL